ncbi:CHAP domain-containing protein [Flexivirga alba]|uniref:CHAP domain-containing protein n=1 Tax=Flexivirga alba TaxID=702742 RepID=A0ABW2AAS8_9MICO
MNRTAALVGVSAMVAGAAFTMSMPTAHAATARNGVCESGEFCLYYNSGEAGSVSDFSTSISDYGATQPSCYDFKGAGAGKGLCVKNHAASVWNRTSKTVYVYYNSGYAGTKQAIGAGVKVNLIAALKNNNAGHHIGAISTGTAQTPVNDYKAHLSQTYGFAYANCTAFAAYRVNTRDHRAFKEGYGGVHWGNANQWYAAAKRVGIKVDRVPKVGAIAVNTVHHTSTDGVLRGHVAYINKVYANGSFDVEEYNWNVHHGYGTRHIAALNSADGGFQYAIHF